MTDWHALDADEVLRRLDTPPTGLSEDEAEARLARTGPNVLPDERPRPAWRRLLDQVNNLLVQVLVVAAVLAFWLGEVVDGVVILCVVALNALIGFLQEGRAERALAAIRSMVAKEAVVLRDGRRRRVPHTELVPGDIVVLEAGDAVPADARIIWSRALRADESSLTGESVPVDKTPASVAPDAPLAERSSMVFAGTTIVAGQARAAVVATAESTELGRIGALVQTAEGLRSPLLERMDAFARVVAVAVTGIAVMAGALGLARGFEAGESLMIAVALAVSGIPEGLPAVITITLAVGVRRMARRHVLVRRLPAVETLGAVSVICTDKTGTLTINAMTATTIAVPGARYRVTGTGIYDPAGSILAPDGTEVTPGRDEVLDTLLAAGALCNDAEIRQDAEGEWQLVGDPLDGALLILAMKAGLDVADLRRRIPRDDEIPFDPSHRLMATLHHGHEDGGMIVIKGAPETVLALTTKGPDGAPLEIAAWETLAAEMAAAGQRVIALAHIPVAETCRQLTFDMLRDATLLGLVGMVDPPRPEVPGAVAECHAAGVRVVMITGDHLVTARAIAREVGIAEEPVAVAGATIAAMPDDELDRRIDRIDVIARATPEDKQRIVRSIRRKGGVVAMTGDGVNDAPALRMADVGIAMGKRGTEAARRAAHVVLADDNFVSITAGVREGRIVWDNIRKVIAWTLPTNTGEILLVLGALAWGALLPVTPLQILWINLVTAIAMGLPLAFEPAEPDVMARPPRRRHARLLSWRDGAESLLIGAVIAGAAVAALLDATAEGRSLESARTLAVNAIVTAELAYLLAVRRFSGPILSPDILRGNPAVWIGAAVMAGAQLAFTFFAPLGRVMGSSPGRPGDLWFLGAVLLTVLVVARLFRALRPLQ